MSNAEKERGPKSSRSLAPHPLWAEKSRNREILPWWFLVFRVLKILNASTLKESIGCFKGFLVGFAYLGILSFALRSRQSIPCSQRGAKGRFSNVF